MELLNSLKKYFDTGPNNVLEKLRNRIDLFKKNLENNPQKLEIHKNACALLPLYIKKINSKTTNNLVKLSFVTMFLKYLGGNKDKIIWDQIKPLTNQDAVNYQELTQDDIKTGISNINKLAILKLNGGLGTSMGCTGPKSAIKVDGNSSFLDIICKQILAQRKKYNASLPLIFMNSFNTTTETKSIIGNKIDYLEFLQNEFPKIDATTNAPFSFATDPSKEWNPPGHGDLFLSLTVSGTLIKLLAQGIKYVFISNSDNLGAVTDPAILGYMINQNLEFIVETTPKTKADVKGGTIIRYQEHLSLLERAQVEEKNLSEFEDIQKFKIFNTNNIWLDLNALNSKFQKETILDLPLIINPKKVSDLPVIQLEQAMGAAIGIFNKTNTIIVDRNRFLPVKKTNDLLILQSDYLEKSPDGTFRFRPDNKLQAYPEISFSSEFSTVEKYQEHFKSIPSLKGIEKLEVDGDVYFKENVSLKGNINIKSTKGQKLIIENKELKNQNLTT
ncbi:UTP--glucose-1-phosphate uridylyltransferase [Candidatus Margulisiibacteriota bacterium]